MKKFLKYCVLSVLFMCVLAGAFIVLQKRKTEFWFSTAMLAASAKHALQAELIQSDTYFTNFSMLFFQAKLALKHIFYSKNFDKQLCQKIGNYDIWFNDYGELLHLFDEVFIQKLYFFSAATQSPFIIDCGSHIGTTVLFFKTLYPQAKIIAIEPDERNFALLTKNVEANALSNVTIIKKALHDHTGMLNFYHGDGATTQSSLINHKNFKHIKQVECMPLSELITEPVDFLKMDIEGAEHVVFEELDSKNKLRLIKEMVLEYHHHLNKSEDKLSPFLAILEKNNFGYQIRHGGHAAISDKMAQQCLIIYAYQKN